MKIIQQVIKNSHVMPGYHYIDNPDIVDIGIQEQFKQLERLYNGTHFAYHIAITLEEADKYFDKNDYINHVFLERIREIDRLLTNQINLSFSEN